MRLPMFPLSIVVPPRSALPLQVFEDRYRLLMDDVMDTDGRFGTVLIERGSEIGGGDLRASVGSLVSMTATQQLDDGRLLVIGLAGPRIRVTAWLPDDPYPVADVEIIEEPPAEALDLRRLTAALKQVSAATIELGEQCLPVGYVLPDDPVDAIWEVLAGTPLSSLDKQRLLELDDAAQRLEQASAALEELAELQHMRLRSPAG